MFSRLKWTFSTKARYVLTSDHSKEKRKVFKGSIFSIIAGFLTASILLICLLVNPFEYFYYVFTFSFSSRLLSQTLNWTAVYIIAAISMAIAFRCGVFNIGASGQILTSTCLSTIILVLVKGKTITSIDSGTIFLLFIVCVVSSSILAFLAGLLKALFNIHEVVSTILLNWTAFFTLKWFFEFTGNKFMSTTPGVTLTIPSNQLNIGDNRWLLPIIIAMICVIFVWVLFSKTTLGFKLKAVGSSPSGSQYVGINVKTQIVGALTLSGAFAGLAAFVALFTVTPNTSFANDSLPTLGFDAIAVSLVAFNNPIGIIGTASLWASIKTGAASASGTYLISTQLSSLISGILIYFTAISSIFIRLEPWVAIKNKFYILNSGINLKIIRKLKAHIRKLKSKKRFLCLSSEYKERLEQEYIAYCKQNNIDINNEQVTLLAKKWNGRKNLKLVMKKEINSLISLCKNKLEEVKKHVKEEKTELNVCGLKTELSKEKDLIISNFIKKQRNLNLEFSTQKDKVRKTRDSILNSYKNLLEKNKAEHKSILQAIKMNKETEISVLTWEFEYRDNLIQIKAEKLTAIDNINEHIKSAKSEFKLQREILRLNKELTSEDKKVKYDEIKQKFNELISQLKQDKKEVIFKAKQESQDWKDKFKAQKLKVEQEKVELQAILDKAQRLVEEENKRFELEKQKALEFKQEFDSKVDMNRSKQEVEQATMLLNDLKTIFKDQLVKDVTNEALSTNNEVLTKSLEIKNKIDEILTQQVVNSYDAAEYMKDKIRINLSSLKLIINIQKEINYIQSRIDENKTIKIFNESITKAKELVDSQKEQYLETINSAANETIQDLDQLINLERTYKENMNSKVIEINQKIVKEGV
ncbi:ABC transporter permease [Mycoplasma cottewii]|uniref:ABC transporter permease n=1 Tax=Mycoplasma cottewii TaxID=51364 RepID=A0ABY5U015_9MOLU|nr:ABC transporter permease [Mycoplasma cottewii]UWD35201.1 ABC transporter permease [Mycoplasma cottewii]